MQGPGVETIEVEGEGRRYTLSFSNMPNVQGHLLDVLAGSTYAAPRDKRIKPTLIIDAGANVGASVIFFRHKYPDIPIICYEPAAENLSFLRLNATQAAPVEIIPCGLSTKEGYGRLYHGKNYGLQNSIHDSIETDPERYEEIKLLDASKELSSRIIPGTLLKLDIEGGELEILQGISKRFDDLLLIFVEFHSQRERREIDNLLEKTHTLYAGKITDLHRGSMSYVNNAVLREYPDLNRLEIKR